MNDATDGVKGTVYQAPTIYVTLFYTLLTIWTVVSVPLIISKASGLGTALELMIGFVIVFTWYWSLGISYRIRMEDDGNIQLTSFRRSIRVHSRKIDQIVGPPLPICFGFIRFRLEREKVYLFFDKKRPLQQILSTIRTLNPDVRFKNLSPKMCQIPLL